MRKISIGFLLVLLVVLFVACGGNESTSSTTGSNDTASTASGDAQAIPTPTQPVGNFQAVGEQSILTDTASLTSTTQTTASSSTSSSTASDLGQRSYAKNKCNECHGEKGEGVADKGKAIAGTSLSAESFDNVLRTGGGLGNSHIYGRSAISPTGMEALYAYVQGLK